MSYIVEEATGTTQTQYPCVDTAALHAQIAALSDRVDALENDNEDENGGR